MQNQVVAVCSIAATLKAGQAQQVVFKVKMMMMMVMVVMMVMISFVSKTVKSTPILFPALSANVLESLKLVRRGSNRFVYCIVMILYFYSMQ